MRQSIATSLGLISMLVALTGCEDRDPYRRTDVWRPTGASAGNLAAQIANPNDLIRGRSGSPGDSRGAAIAVERVWAGQPRALPSGSGYSSGGAGGGASGAGNGS